MLIEWLMTGEPWVQYRTKIDLQHFSTDDPEMITLITARILKRLLQDF
jgi:hypothetical protein